MHITMRNNSKAPTNQLRGHLLHPSIVTVEHYSGRLAIYRSNEGIHLIRAWHLYIHTHIYTYTYISPLKNKHIYFHAYTYIHTNIHAYIHTYMFTFIHTYMHTYIQYIHTYIHTYIQTYQGGDSEVYKQVFSRFDGPAEGVHPSDAEIDTSSERT